MRNAHVRELGLTLGGFGGRARRRAGTTLPNGWLCVHRNGKECLS